MAMTFLEKTFTAAEHFLLPNTITKRHVSFCRPPAALFACKTSVFPATCSHALLSGLNAVQAKTRTQESDFRIYVFVV